MNEISGDICSCQKTRLLSRLLGNYSRLSQELNSKMSKELSLSIAKYEVMLAIDRSPSGEITMSNLSRELMVSNANMTGMTTRLLSDGYVEKKTLPTDRRIYNVALTDKGRGKLKTAHEKHCIWTRALMDCFAETEVELMNGLLDKMEKQTDCFSNPSI